MLKSSDGETKLPEALALSRQLYQQQKKPTSTETILNQTNKTETCLQIKRSET
jgi:hypothetical protein